MPITEAYRIFGVTGYCAVEVLSFGESGPVRATSPRTGGER